MIKRLARWRSGDVAEAREAVEIMIEENPQSFMALQSAYIFAGKVPLSEREDMMQELLVRSLRKKAGVDQPTLAPA